MIAMQRLDSAEPGFREALAAMARSAPETDPALDARVREIVRRVREEGDAALLELTARYDRRPVERPFARYSQSLSLQ